MPSKRLLARKRRSPEMQVITQQVHDKPLFVPTQMVFVKPSLRAVGAPYAEVLSARRRKGQWQYDIEMAESGEPLLADEVHLAALGDH